ncbi:MAG: haloacid dehalogenase type II [Rhodobacteraceae bacterium]|nr:haloacid dehalogenase type II [Paracoccaceae bacterium]MCF8515962.1 haloacid dehalogenase type II [Paracoccaceae bacterium]MCF8520269.1 haloacid dehalogenase type II [Paracoccaceae bacterium]
MRHELLVFDAYGTLFDVAAAARMAATRPDAGRLAEVWPKLAEDWRRKQLEYSWLRTIMGAHADFATVTAEALDWAMEAQGLGTERGLRAVLLGLYDQLAPYPEVPAVLNALRQKGLRLAILSNGAPAMLQSAVRSAGIDGLIEACLSVEEVTTFKPAAVVYGLVEARLGVAPAQVLFVSSNGWDVAGAARFGFTTAWVNRSGAPIDRLPHGPAHILPDLTHLPEIA